VVDPRPLRVIANGRKEIGVVQVVVGNVIRVSLIIRIAELEITIIVLELKPFLLYMRREFWISTSFWAGN
jgi:hypothetical protein